MQSDLSTSIDKLAGKLDIAGDGLCKAMLQQAHLEIWFDLLYLVIAIVGAIVSIAIYKKLCVWVRSEYPDDYVCPIALLSILLGLVLFLAGLSLILNSYDLITAYTNPEFWALKELLHK